jgi:serine/threonine protein kinase
MENGLLKEYIQRSSYNAKQEIPRLVSVRTPRYDEHTEQHARKQLYGIAQGITYLHLLMITHGDIKHVCIPVSLAEGYGI